jgi:hypothetical protein
VRASDFAAWPREGCRAWNSPSWIYRTKSSALGRSSRSFTLKAFVARIAMLRPAFMSFASTSQVGSTTTVVGAAVKNSVRGQELCLKALTIRPVSCGGLCKARPPVSLSRTSPKKCLASALGCRNSVIRYDPLCSRFSVRHRKSPRENEPDHPSKNHPIAADATECEREGEQGGRDAKRPPGPCFQLPLITRHSSGTTHYSALTRYKSRWGICVQLVT